MANGGVVLEMRGISKAFPGVQALQRVDLQVRAGEVHALVGENGAGKSTLMKVLVGEHAADEGQIILHGAPVHVAGPRHSQALGISIIHQELHLVPQLSVAENVFLGRLLVSAGLISRHKMEQSAGALLHSLGCDISPKEIVGDLSTAQQQMVEVAKALSLNASLVVMDEPTSSLTERETALLFQSIARLKNQGIAVVYISHRMEEIFAIADRVTVLRDGLSVGTFSISEVNETQLVSLMVGRELSSSYYGEREGEIGAPLLEVRGLQRHGLLQDVSFRLHRGEILGLAGLVGAGRSELARALFGIDPIDGGEVWLEGRRVRISGPGDAVQLGFGFAPEDRKLQGLILGMRVRENLSLAALSRCARMGVVDRHRERRLAQQFVDTLSIRTPSLEQRILNLSGGNQQKVVLGRWLALNPRVLILDEPTRGIDVGAKAEIHALIRRLAAQGVGILLISSELPEVLGMSDRILVMNEGRVCGEFTHAEANQEDVLRCAMG